MHCLLWFIHSHHGPEGESAIASQHFWLAASGRCQSNALTFHAGCGVPAASRAQAFLPVKICLVSSSSPCLRDVSAAANP